MRVVGIVAMRMGSHRLPGKSLIDRVQYMVDGGIIEVSCWKWSKEIKKNKPWRDTLQVSIRSEIFNDWLTNEAYK